VTSFLWLALVAYAAELAVHADPFVSTAPVVNQSLYTYRDEAYAIDVGVGTPPQMVQLAFRSSSEDTVVAGSECSACCHHNTFDQTKSSTYVRTGKKWRNHHQEHIYYSLDNMQAFGVTKTNQSFFLTVFSNGTNDFPAQPFDGHFNAGFLLNSDGSSPLFTLYAKRTCATNHSANAGWITMNAVNTVNCAPATVEIPSNFGNNRYTVQLESYKFGSKTASTMWNAVLSAKSPEIIVPEDVFKAFNSTLHPTLNKDGQYEVPCNANPGDLSLTFIGSTPLIVPWHQLVRQVGNVCTMLVIPRKAGHSATDPTEWSLGLPFLRQYCQIFGAGGSRIKFAPHKVAADPACTYGTVPAAPPACPAPHIATSTHAPAGTTSTLAPAGNLTGTTPKSAAAKWPSFAGLLIAFGVLFLAHYSA
jgi:hypothetical protein